MRNPNIRKVSEQAKKYTQHYNNWRFVKTELTNGVEATIDRVALSRMPYLEQEKLIAKNDKKS